MFYLDFNLVWFYSYIYICLHIYIHIYNYIYYLFSKNDTSQVACTRTSLLFLFRLLDFNWSDVSTNSFLWFNFQMDIEPPNRLERKV